MLSPQCAIYIISSPPQQREWRAFKNKEVVADYKGNCFLERAGEWQIRTHMGHERTHRTCAISIWSLQTGAGGSSASKGPTCSYLPSALKPRPGDLVPSPASHKHCTHVLHIHTCWQNTHGHKIK